MDIITEYYISCFITAAFITTVAALTKRWEMKILIFITGTIAFSFIYAFIGLSLHIGK